MRAAKSDTPSAPETPAGDLPEQTNNETTEATLQPETASVVVALTAVSDPASTALLPTMPKATETIPPSEMVEPPLPSTVTEQPTSDPVGAPPPVQTVSVRIEPLGVGVANLLVGAVEQVVKVAQGISTGGTPKKVNPSTARPRPQPRQGVPGIMAGVESFFQTGANLLSGLAACLQESVGCMGKVIRNPTQRPCSKPAATQKAAPQAPSRAV